MYEGDRVKRLEEIKSKGALNAHPDDVVYLMDTIENQTKCIHFLILSLRGLDNEEQILMGYKKFLETLWIDE